MKKISVIFAGTGDFGVPTLEKLCADEKFTIPFVITAPDKRAGRNLSIAVSPVKKAAIANNLIVHQPERIEVSKQNVIQAAPDFLLVVAYGQIIKEDILKIPQFAPVNIHASLLPAYRGASPIHESILNGDKKTGVTWIFMNTKLDGGDIIAQKTAAIAPDDNSIILSAKLAQLAAAQTPDALFNFFKNPSKMPQKGTPSYCRKIRKEDGNINVHEESAEQIIRKIKAYVPWPGCALPWNNKRLKIVQAAVGEQKISSGEIRVLGKNTLIIGTKSQALMPQIVQPESKQKMPIEAFLAGQKNIPAKI